MNIFFNITSSLFFFSTILGSQSSKQVNLVDPCCVEVMPVQEVEKKLKVLESSSKFTNNWQEIKASEIYKEHAALHDRLNSTQKEVQIIYEQLKKANISENETGCLQDEVHDLASRLFGESGDLTKFESSCTACPHLLDRANLYAIYWRSKYEELKASGEQSGKDTK